MSLSSLVASSTTSLQPSPTSTPTSGDGIPSSHNGSVVSFLIGLGIVLLASVLNAAGLNLTKLDHVRTSAIPKSSRKKDWLRPLWLLGMLLYILSQLIGSTLALEYMRAEYVAPLGSTSLVFNFLFARFLVGTPVTSTDIYGTVVVVVGVIGIVVFGSINSGLATETDVNHLTYLWRRPGWLAFFFTMASALTVLFIFTSSLDAVLVARTDLEAEPFAGMSARQRPVTVAGFWPKVKAFWSRSTIRINESLENWTASKSDKTIAWTLGIGWACCGGGLAGGCLVFAKAVVKLISGSLSHQNEGNQFGHIAPIFSIILLATTAILQIICLNRGLKAYDSTLVVPVFYGVYTATGFLDSLVFNDEVGSYKTWTLFCIFFSILVLISGVVLLTHKKPEPRVPAANANNASSGSTATRSKSHKKTDTEDATNPFEDGEALTTRSQGHAGAREDVLWQVGDHSDVDDETSDFGHGKQQKTQTRGVGVGSAGTSQRNDRHALIEADLTEAESRRSGESDVTIGPGDMADPFRDQTEDFGEWQAANKSKRR